MSLVFVTTIRLARMKGRLLSPGSSARESQENVYGSGIFVPFAKALFVSSTRRRRRSSGRAFVASEFEMDEIGDGCSVQAGSALGRLKSY